MSNRGAVNIVFKIKSGQNGHYKKEKLNKLNTIKKQTMEEVIRIRMTRKFKNELRSLCREREINMSDLVRVSLVRTIKDLDFQTQNKTIGRTFCQS